jgi:hypothetical protein
VVKETKPALTHKLPVTLRECAYDKEVYRQAIPEVGPLFFRANFDSVALPTDQRVTTTIAFMQISWLRFPRILVDG